MPTTPGSRWRANLAGASPVIHSRGKAQEALARTRGVMAKLGLTIDEAKTSVKDARVETFDFLGFSVLQRQTERRTDVVVQLCER
jgi:RNA-directed DNA polymerase